MSETNYRVGRRWSPIWKMSKSDFSKLVKKSRTQTEVLKELGLRNIGGNASTLKRRMSLENIDFSHLGWKNAVHRGGVKAEALEGVLKVGSNYNRRRLKKRLLEAGLLKEECSVCGLGPIWEGKKLMLIIDHINGISDDNRLENLRMVCPNCGSQLSTFAGRNARKREG